MHCHKPPLQSLCVEATCTSDSHSLQCAVHIIYLVAALCRLETADQGTELAMNRQTWGDRDCIKKCRYFRTFLGWSWTNMPRSYLLAVVLDQPGQLTEAKPTADWRQWLG